MFLRKMEVTITTSNLTMKIKNGRITMFDLNGRQDIKELLGHMNRLTRTIDDITMATVSVEHINHAAANNHLQTLRTQLRTVEDDMTLHCSCSNCLLSYLRGCIDTKSIPGNLLQEVAPVLYKDINTDS